MVQANPEGDGIERTVPYAKFRDDKPAETGYSAELVNIDIDPQFYDDLAGQPFLRSDYSTIMAHFKKQVMTRGDEPMMGSRPKTGVDDKGKPTFGSY